MLFFFSGLHGDYHKPSDTWDKIDAPDAAKLLTWWRKSPTICGRRPTGRNSCGWRRRIRMAEGAGPISASRPAGYGPWFGSIPDFGEGVEGREVCRCAPGSPAAKAGFKAGDVMVEFDGKAIQNLYDFTYALRAKKPGEKVKVKVLREGKTIEATVLLTKRP